MDMNQPHFDYRTLRMQADSAAPRRGPAPWRAGAVA
jgi:hypothetical protein